MSRKASVFAIRRQSTANESPTKLTSLSFKVYATSEIKKFSVLEIDNDKIFDSTGEPSQRGLYDYRLGPNQPGEHCGTCSLSYNKCPGHSGHIALPARVYNPVFLPSLFKILRGCCFSCHRIMAPEIDIRLMLYQLEVLKYGLLSTVGTLDGVCRTVKKDVTVEEERKFAVSDERMKLIFFQALEDLDTLEEQLSASIVECKKTLIETFIKKHFMGAKEKCPHCFAPKEKLSLLKKCIVFRRGRNMPVNVNYSTKDISSSVNCEAPPLVSDKELLPDEARALLFLVWKEDKYFLKSICRVLCTEVKTEEPIDAFFMDTIVVPPLKFRGFCVLKNKKYADEQTLVLNDFVKDCNTFRNLLKSNSLQKQPLITALKQLQKSVNKILDCDTNQGTMRRRKGVKQILEGKEGLFRRNLMGKRVNYAGRSVITPDPYILVNEVGIPLEFAKTLTFPESVTSFNVEKLREAVRNGPDRYPGANLVVYEDGKVVHLEDEIAAYRKLIAECHLNPTLEGGVKTVYRHCNEGDMLLLNRQPTLHRPSIMAHKAKILPGEKTLRLHYAHCKAYNADFDGDEMNVHLPQSYAAQAECREILNANQQYLVPKDGTPLTGLIQDHIVAGVLLTVRNSFLDKEHYHQLVHSAIYFLNRRVKLLPPCMLKPQELWSGKQVVSTVLLNIIPKDKPPPNLIGKAKISSKKWQNEAEREWQAGGSPLYGHSMSESEVIIRGGELLSGVIDKAQIGATSFGLVHLCYELYGGETATLLLSAFSRLFTYYLQYYSGFSMAIDDLVLNPESAQRRLQILNGVRNQALSTFADALDMDSDEDPDAEKIRTEYRIAHLAKDDSQLQLIDDGMKKMCKNISTKLSTTCMRNGLLKKFPANNLQLMVESGAKGTPVNAMQMCCLVGQTELEGKIMPLMLNGKTLASFDAYDLSPEARGFITSSYYLGLKPEEYFFQCMAGREGLIDSAVKTSTSGYIQRRLVKHLEGLNVSYDLTVRDSDGTVIQFRYGEDGLDVTKMQLLKNSHLHLLANNYLSVMNRQEIHELLKAHPPGLRMFKTEIIQWKKQHPEKIRFLSPVSEIDCNVAPDYKMVLRKRNCLKSRLNEESLIRYQEVTTRCPDSVISKFRPDTVLGCVSEKMDEELSHHIQNNIFHFLNSNRVEEHFSETDFLALYYHRALRSLVEPGEAVGILAAQSIGEPSTQMTLNTFHFAGKGEMNVTLGIPRVQEIINATKMIKTPTMDLPLLEGPFEKEFANILRSKLSPLPLKEVLEKIEVKESLSVSPHGSKMCYEVHFNLLDCSELAKFQDSTPETILLYIKEDFSRLLTETIKKRALKVSRLEMEVKACIKDTTYLEIPDNEDSGFFNASERGGSSYSSDNEYDRTEVDTVVGRRRRSIELDYSDDEGSSSEEENDFSYQMRKHRLEESENSEEEDETQNERSIQAIPSVSPSPKTSTPQRSMDIRDISMDFQYDEQEKKWCALLFELDVEQSRMNLKALLENVVDKAFIHSVSGIKEALIVREGSKTVLKTNGVNFLDVFKYAEILDINKLYSNDIHSISKIYGIEAAAKAIQKELHRVFKVYGIQVDPRHLSLISDYMTSGGVYRPFDRRGLKNCASPLQQMSFETTTNFMVDSMFLGIDDQLASPSANIVVGQRCRMGTGSFDVIQSLDVDK